ncbi:MAG: GTP 3',8-cyclase MoaA [Bacteroidales bacterium]
MLDRFNRKINYLRISVTDRCNLRCTYCVPSGKFQWLPHSRILTFEEITEVVRTASELGINKVRLTGGEPLVRKDITQLVAMIAGIKSIDDLAMTTNGILLEKFAKPLKEAGLMRVNVSLDTTDPQRYAEITRGGDIEAVFRGIDAALAVGLQPVKLNCVVKHSRNEPDAQLVAEYAAAKGLQVRYIHQMNLAGGYFTTVEGGEGGNCSLCNRLRLTAEGLIKPCLFSNLGFDIRKMGVREALMAAVEHKPHSGTINQANDFYNIGG